METLTGVPEMETLADCHRCQLSAGDGDTG